MSKTALLVIDVQNGMFDPAYPIYQGEALLSRLQTAIAKAREAGADVIYVRHNEEEGLVYGTPAWEVHPAIAPAAGDLIIEKKTPDSFHETGLQAALEARGIKRLILSGLQSEFCVDTTCRRAFSLGYETTLVKDAHSTYNSDHLTAQQIIDHHNRTLRSFAKVQELAEVRF